MGKLQKAADGITEAPVTKGLTTSQRGNAPTPSDEYYTSAADAERLIVRLAPLIGDKMVYLPFDAPESEFCNACNKFSIPFVHSWGDYRKNLDYMRKHADDTVVISNPPFSIWKQIVRDLNETGIKYYLMNNLMNAHHFPAFGIYGAYFGKCVFKNGKGVPCCIMSNDDIRAIDFSEPEKRKEPPTINGKRFYTKKRDWIADGKPVGCYINSVFPIYKESMDYDFSGPYHFVSHFNVFYIEGRAKDGKGKYCGLRSERKSDCA